MDASADLLRNAARLLQRLLSANAATDITAAEVAASAAAPFSSHPYPQMKNDKIKIQVRRVPASLSTRAK